MCVRQVRCAKKGWIRALRIHLVTKAKCPRSDAPVYAFAD